MENNEMINNEIVEQATESITFSADCTARSLVCIALISGAATLGVKAVNAGCNGIKKLWAKRKAKKEDYEYEIDGEKVEIVD